MLARPLDWRIAQSGDADATWQSTFNGRLHKIGCKEGERYCHVDLAYAASFAFRDAFDAGLCIVDKLVEPPPSPGDRCDQGRAGLRTDRTSLSGSRCRQAQESHGVALMVSCATGHGGSSPLCARLRLVFSGLGKLDDQLLRLDLDPRNVSADEAAVVNRCRRFEMLPNRPCDQRLDLGRWHPAN